MTTEFSDKQFTNYFRLNIYQLNEILHIIKDTIFSEGCNAQRPIDPQLLFFPSCRCNCQTAKMKHWNKRWKTGPHFRMNLCRKHCVAQVDVGVALRCPALLLNLRSYIQSNRLQKPVLHSTVLCVLCYAALYCAALYCAVLYCTALRYVACITICAQPYSCF